MTHAGRCRLCGQQRDLRHSHILPEFLYRPTYDDKHRALVLAREEGTESLLQKGYREYLLCARCEGQFNRYETYFKRMWFDSNALPPTLKRGVHVHTIEGLDYKLFRLFHLSVLWRASVSAGEMFQEVRLGGRHEEGIRALLRNEDPGPPERYHWGATIVFGPDGAADHMIMQPVRRQRLGRTVFIFMYGGCVWMYVVGAAPLPRLVRIAFREDGRQVLLVRHMVEIPVLRDFFTDYIRHQPAAR